VVPLKERTIDQVRQAYDRSQITDAAVEFLRELMDGPPRWQRPADRQPALWHRAAAGRLATAFDASRARLDVDWWIAET
jgi:hypothetical protein